MIRRIFLFLLTNLAVLVLITIMLSVISAVFGINLSGYGTNMTELLIFSAIIGFSGSFISLWMSKGVAKRAYKLKMITQETLGTLDKKQALVYEIVKTIAANDHIKMPEVGIYDSPTPNAFATGPTKNKSLVAVSTGLLNDMTPDAIEGVVAHEMAHVINGDMVTMTLLQGVINTFVVFLSRLLANVAQNAVSGDDESTSPGAVYFIVSIGCDILFGMLASLVVMAYSRHREFRADEGSAKFVGKDKMIAALEILKKHQAMAPKSTAKLATSMITTNDRVSGFKKYFMSHPPLVDRIQNVQDFRM